MLIYILKFSACLAIFMVFYKLFLEKSSIHSFKRFYLLGALVLAFIIPSLTFIEYIEPMVFENFEMIEPMTTFDEVDTIPLEVSINYTPIILWSIYGLGVLIFLLKFCLNLYRIISKIKNNPKLKSESFINVLVSNLMIPHTFFNYIFLNKYKFEHAEIPKEVLLHEQTHAKQKHSIDVLLLEFLQILFWFNPLIYFLKKEVKLNHEFLADRAVLLNGIQPSAYQQLLLAFSSNANEPQLANAINYSSIKKRFTVMKTKTSKSSIWFRSLLILPLLAILLYSFTERKQVVKESSDLIEFNSSEGVSEELMKEYNDFIIMFKTTNMINYSEYERIVSIYNLMSDKQKASVEAYPIAPVVDLSKTKAKVPTTAEFESWKNDKEFAIWIDGVHVPNAKLNSYALNDIAHYMGSFVYKNARSKKFPQPYQFRLFTKKGFQKTFQESKIKQYKELTEKYSKAIDVFLKGDRLDNSELILLNERCYRLYKSFSEEEKKQHNLLPAPPPPAKKSPQQDATPKQLAEYNKLAKAYNKKPLEQRIIKVKDFKKLESLYKQMSAEQKKNAQAFPDFPPPPPRPTKSKTGNGPNAEEWEKVEQILKNHTSSEYQRQPMWILLNNKGQFLVNDEIGTLKTIENDFKAIVNNYSKSKKVVFKYDPNAPKETVSNFMLLMKKYGFENLSSDDVLIPPPPPPIDGPNKSTKTGFKKINGVPHYFVSIEGKTKYYNRQGFETSKNGEVISATQVNASDVIPNQYITKVHSDGKIMAEFKDNMPSTRKDVVDIPSPPPASKSTLDFAIDLAKKNAKFYYENEEISSDKAIALLKKNPDLNLLAKNTTKKQPLVYISLEPITFQKQQKSKEPVKINGKTPVNDQLTLGKYDFKNLKLTLDDADVKSFKFKVPGKPSCSNSGNTLNNLSKTLFRTVSSGKVVQFFDIKDSKGFVHPPVVVKISNKLVGVLGTTELLVMVNGKTPVDDQLTLSKKEFEDLKLTMKKLEVKSFKLKIQGKRSQYIIGNHLDEKAKSYVDDISEGSVVQFFDIKCTTNLKLKPIIVTITK